MHETSGSGRPYTSLRSLQLSFFGRLVPWPTNCPAVPCQLPATVDVLERRLVFALGIVLSWEVEGMTSASGTPSGCIVSVGSLTGGVAGAPPPANSLQASGLPIEATP